MKQKMRQEVRYISNTYIIVKTNVSYIINNNNYCCLCCCCCWWWWWWRWWWSCCYNCSYCFYLYFIYRFSPYQASVSATDKSGRTALHHCVENLDTDCADYLLKRDTSLLNTPDNEGLTPLHMSAITGNEAMLHLLLKKGANLTCLDEEKHTVVHWATGETRTTSLQK